MSDRLNSSISPLELLTTTRSVRRRLDLDRPVAIDLLRASLEIALQAPNGADEQSWRWIIVTDATQRERIGELYGRTNAAFAANIRELAESGDLGAQRTLASSGVFWDHLERVPALIVAAFKPPQWFDGSNYALASSFGSVFPAVWNLQLALRLHGLGSCLMTAQLREEREMAAILELPDDLRQVALIAVGHLLGDRFQRAPRRPLDEVMRFDRWSEEPTHGG